MKIWSKTLLHNPLKKLQLIKNGVPQLSYRVVSDTNHAFVLNDGYISMSCQQWGREWFVYNTNEDLTKFSKIYVEYSYPNPYKGSYYNNMVFRFYGYNTQTEESVILQEIFTNDRTVRNKTTAEFEYTYDGKIPTIGLINSAANSDYGQYPVNIYNLWLE